MKKIKLFTHTDLDGVGCAIVAIKVLGADCVDVEYVNYDNVNQKILGWLQNYDNKIYDTCYITDISVSEETAKVLNNTDLNLCLLDHHATATELNKYGWCEVRSVDRFGVPTSGTDMLYEHFLAPANESLRQFVKAVRDYDTWQWVKTPDGEFSKSLNDLLTIYGRDRFIRKALLTLSFNSFRRDFITEPDAQILQLEQEKIDRMVAEKNKEIRANSLFGYKAGVVFAEEHISELGNKLCCLNPELDFIVLVNMAAKTISFRTIKDIDLGKDIASRFGGGGHPKAAGAAISDNTEQVLLATLFGEMAREKKNE